MTADTAARIEAALASALPGTYVAVDRDGNVLRVVPKGPQGQYTLAHIVEAQ